MAAIMRNPKREHRISMEIVVDAYTPEEQAMGWYYYLDDKLNFPFRARCVAPTKISPLRKGEIVEVVAMAPEDDCTHGMIVIIKWDKRRLGVPLSQLKPIGGRGETTEAIADWHYWIDQGYKL